jgi:hypothetical protein
LSGESDESSGGYITTGAFLFILLLVFVWGRGTDGTDTGNTSGSNTRHMATYPDSPISGVFDPSAVISITGDVKHLTDFPQPATCTVHVASNGEWLPDKNCTPGVTSTRVTQENIKYTICAAGYTKDIRPSGSKMNKAKKIAAEAYNVTAVLGEYDHLIPLELGGANDTRNLWLEPGKQPNNKDKVENALHRLVCSGKIQLADAQQRMSTDWTTALVGLPNK